VEVISQAGAKFGAEVHGFDFRTATDDDCRTLREAVYREKIAVLKNQHLDTGEFVALGRRLGEPEAYYEPMYHHPEEPLVFVSSNVPENGKQVGVPKTGKFWHADYQFMARPFALTLIHPKVVPTRNRGTFFIDMGRAYEALPQELKKAIAGTYARQDVRRYFKIRPEDVYRPVGELVAEIEQKTPALAHPTVFRHPVTGERVLYVSEGFTRAVEDAAGNELEPELLARLFEESGQRDQTFDHPGIHLQTFEEGDLLVWDNRSLIHRALHTATAEHAVSHRVTLHDEHPFHDGVPA
jgi:alpha-ketoglutarate-dependent taurine dioxygenase